MPIAGRPRCDRPGPRFGGFSLAGAAAPHSSSILIAGEGVRVVGRRKPWFFAAMIAASACDTDEPAAADPQDPTARLLEANGFRLNGFRLNGFRLNGFRLNGFRLNGDAGSADYIELERIRLPDGPPVVQSWLVGSDLHVQTEQGVILSGAQLVGAELDFAVQEGVLGKRAKRVKITGAAPLAGRPDVWLYDLALKELSGPWTPLCLDGLGLPTATILLGDAWDPETGDRLTPRPPGVVTFACRDAALAKCVEWGYRPWASAGDVALADHHQACTRAVRADYCGDGTPHTIDGLTIHVLDPLGIQTAEPNATYAVEGEWGPDGALCLDPGNTRLPGEIVACALPPCGDAFASGGLLQTGKVLP